MYLGYAGHDVAPRATPTKTSAYSAHFGDLVVCDTTAAGFTVTLPPADRVGDIHVRLAAGTNTLTIDGYGAETVDGAASSVMTIAGEARILTCDGDGHWFTAASAPLAGAITSLVTSLVSSQMANYQPLPMTVNTQILGGGSYTLPDINVAQAHDLTLTADVTFVFPASSTGKEFRIVIRQDGVGGHVITWPANVRTPNGAFNLTLSAGATDSVYCFSVRPTHWGAVLEGKSYFP